MKVGPGDDDRKKLLKEKYNTALQAIKSLQFHQKLHPTEAAFTDVVAIARQLLAADIALHKSENLVPVYERYCELMNCVDAGVALLHKDNVISPATYEAVHEARLDAEVKLLDVKGGTAPGPVRARASGQK